MVIVLFLLIPLLPLAALLIFRRLFRARHEKARLFHLLLGNTLLLLLLLSLIPLLGEIYYGFFYDQTDSLAYTKTSRHWFARHWVNNPSGIRDDINYALALKPGKRRLTFVGDSFTVGQGIKNVNDRFPNIIRSAHPDWDVQILGQLGFDTG